MSAQLQLRAALRFVDVEDQKLLVIGAPEDFARATVHLAESACSDAVNVRLHRGLCEGMPAAVRGLIS